MNREAKFFKSMVRGVGLVIVLGVLILSATTNSWADQLQGPLQRPTMPPALSLTNTIRVPQQAASIAIAIGMANPGDTILVDKGNWCGTYIPFMVDLEGRPGATIIGCSSGPTQLGARIGFLIGYSASGTIIHNFTFNGNGISDSNPNPLAFGVLAEFGANNVVVEQNNFQGGFGDVLGLGSGWVISQNKFTNFTRSCLGQFSGFAVALLYYGSETKTAHQNDGLPVSVSNSAVVDNEIHTNNFPDCLLSSLSWLVEVPVPLAGVVVAGQVGAVIADNKIAIHTDKTAFDGVGIVATGEFFFFPNLALSIFDNDTHDNTYGVIVTSDSVSGLTIYNNKGVNWINGVTTIVK